MTDPASAVISITKLSIPITMISAIIGGSAWLTSIKVDLANVQNRFDKVETEFRAFKDITQGKQQTQGEMISKMDGKLDLMLKQLQVIERRINISHSHRK